MSAILIDGKKLRQKKYIEFKKRILKLKKIGIIPKLVVVLIGNDQASKIYIKHKRNACKELGIISEEINLSKDVSYEELATVIDKLNNDNWVDGIIIQFPIPKHLSSYPIGLLLDVNKDVDGLHPFNQGLISTKTNSFALKACTPYGIMELFKEYKINLSGKNVVIIGRSNIVGFPMSYLLTQKNASISIIHSRTKKDDFNRLIKNADIIVSASGTCDLFTPEMVKDDVIIIDVGITRDVNNKLRGDILYKDFMEKASYITPVPGGVGPMTVTMLMNNVITIAEQQNKNEHI